mmetsp:Transcript_60877/g.137649  ORF Transcript_60877/g.137649 Transcript_60877/m.137649 type:complete len:366 (+) Transcript_60877:789-1886(+)
MGPWRCGPAPSLPYRGRSFSVIFRERAAVVLGDVLVRILLRNDFFGGHCSELSDGLLHRGAGHERAGRVVEHRVPALQRGLQLPDRLVRPGRRLGHPVRAHRPHLGGGEHLERGTAQDAQVAAAPAVRQADEPLQALGYSRHAGRRLHRPDRGLRNAPVDADGSALPQTHAAARLHSPHRRVHLRLHRSQLLQGRPRQLAHQRNEGSFRLARHDGGIPRRREHLPRCLLLRVDYHDKCRLWGHHHSEQHGADPGVLLRVRGRVHVRHHHRVHHLGGDAQRHEHGQDQRAARERLLLHRDAGHSRGPWPADPFALPTVLQQQVGHRRAQNFHGDVGVVAARGEHLPRGGEDAQREDLPDDEPQAMA